jgi:hypothetical protein
VYVTEHEADAVVPLNVHVPVNVPLPLVTSTTTPVGVMNVPGEWSVIVTVQLVATPIVAGESQVNADVSDLTLTVKVAVAFGLAGE